MISHSGEAEVARSWSICLASTSGRLEVRLAEPEEHVQRALRLLRHDTVAEHVELRTSRKSKVGHVPDR